MKAKNKKLLKTAGILVVGILLGWLLFGGVDKKEDKLGENHDHTDAVGGNLDLFHAPAN